MRRRRRQRRTSIMRPPHSYRSRPKVACVGLNTVKHTVRVAASLGPLYAMADRSGKPCAPDEVLPLTTQRQSLPSRRNRIL
jgi:hypothetical protein